MQLAQKFPIEIINSDSLQVFRYLDIGTAKPSKEIQNQVPHHLIDILDPDAPFTSNDFQKLAMEKIKDMHARGKIPLLVGGAGFYLRSLSNPTSNLPAGARKIMDAAKAHQELSTKDPIAAKKIHPNDHYRISRALFLLDQGIQPSRAFELSENTSFPYSILWLGISCDRTTLRKRISDRVNVMFQDGILEETRKVVEKFPNSRPRLEKAIGYSECLDVIDRKSNDTKALELTTIHTSQYAKRQDTWFRKNPSIIWSDLGASMDTFSFSIDKLNQV